MILYNAGNGALTIEVTYLQVISSKLKCLSLHFLRANFANGFKWCFSQNPCHFKTATYISNGFIVEKCTIPNFPEGKKYNSFSNFLNSK